MRCSGRTAACVVALWGCVAASPTPVSIRDEPALVTTPMGSDTMTTGTAEWTPDYLRISLHTRAPGCTATLRSDGDVSASILVARPLAVVGEHPIESDVSSLDDINAAVSYFGPGVLTSTWGVQGTLRLDVVDSAAGGRVVGALRAGTSTIGVDGTFDVVVCP